MVRLEHANLVVSDIPATLDFILTAFPDWKVRGRGGNTWNGKPRRWLHVGNDDYYITLNDGAEGKGRDLAGYTPGLAHLGFVVDDMEAISERLQAKGFPIAVEGNEHPYRKTIYFIEPSGVEFEFMQYLSDQPEQRNHYEDTGSTTVDPEYLIESPKQETS